MLDFQIRMTTAEGAGIGLPYVSHDIGSFQAQRLPPDMYVRWVQFGAFQPILRLHSDHGDRLPWEYGGRAERIASGFLRLREALVPYLYTAAREAYDSGLPIARPMYLGWPRAARAYRFDGQYMLGDELLVAPVAEPGKRPTQAGVVSAGTVGRRVHGGGTRRRPQRAPAGAARPDAGLRAEGSDRAPPAGARRFAAVKLIRWRSTSMPGPTGPSPSTRTPGTGSVTAAVSSRARACAGTRAPRR